jgi:hypothetical protein
MLHEQRELEVGEAAAFPDASTLTVDSDSAADDQVHGLEFVQPYAPPFGQGTLDRGVTADSHEWLLFSQTGNGHVEGLAVFARAAADRQLRRVRVGLDDAGGLPLGPLGEAGGRLLGSDEVGDSSTGPREPRGTLALQQGPGALANLLLAVHVQTALPPLVAVEQLLQRHAALHRFRVFADDV